MLNGVYRLLLPALSLTAVVFGFGCRSIQANSTSSRYIEATNLLETVRSEATSNGHLILYRLGIEPRGSQLVLTGMVDSAEARKATLERFKSSGLSVLDQSEFLPAANVGEKSLGICTLSLGSGREYPEHKAELGTQLLMGEVVDILKRTDHAGMGWILVRSRDGYVSWQQAGNLVQCTRQEAETWINGPLLVVTNLEVQVLGEPRQGTEFIGDLVLLNLVTKVETANEWTRIRFPDGREGYIPSDTVCDYKAWRASRQPSADNIELTARRFIGRPYFWGGNSPRGLDCSGFTRTVFALNGIDLRRNASHQASQGKDVSLANDFRELKRGDLLFFGRKATEGMPQKITHVGIYLGNKRFIHSADRVQISSLDPVSPENDSRHSSRLLCARRILLENL